MHTAGDGRGAIAPGMLPEDWATATRAETLSVQPRLPEDAEAMGLSAWTAPGLEMVASMNPNRRRSKVVAWALLLMFAVPVLLQVAMLLFNR